MKKLFTLFGMALLLAAGASAQSTNVTLPFGKLAVYRGGDGTTNFTIGTQRQHPSFIDVFDPVLTNPAPLVSVTMPTNGANSIWINAHAGSEGGAISRSADRQFLAVAGYHGDINESIGTPSSALQTNNGVVSAVFGRGFGVADAFGNFNVTYADPANWFGCPFGVSQDNPTGIATADGTNFWGTGKLSGANGELSGTLFYNAQVSTTPELVQSIVQTAFEVRIINGVLYMVGQTSTAGANGIFNFVDPNNNNAVVPLPWDPNGVPLVQHVVFTNLYINFGSTFASVANFDMNRSNTVCYVADQALGIGKFVNNAGVWSLAYTFGPTNIGTLTQKASARGCFGIAVDFSGTNNVIYATTMELGDGSNTCSNRLIRIVDSGAAGTNRVEQTLAVAPNINEVFRGLDFTPDLRPQIDSAPAAASTTNGGSATFTVSANSVYAVNYQWLQNGATLNGQTNNTLSFNNLSTNLNGFLYQCVVSNQYGAVTSTPPAALSVNFVAVAPSITNTLASVTNFVGNNVSFTVNPSGTQPFSYQWYQGTTALVDDGFKYSGSTNVTLSVSNLATSDDGIYSVVISNVQASISNAVDQLTVIYQLPVITDPQSAITLVGQTGFSLSSTTTGGTPPFSYQWYQGANALSEGNEFTGTSTGTLGISPIGAGDAGDYTVVVSNGGGSTTSHVATVSVIARPVASFVAYSNQLYLQNFNSLPDPGSNSVNSINNPKDSGSINGVAYSLANPFDFAFPVFTSSYIGGLGLSNTMSGWYGAADTQFAGVDGITRFGAQDGDQTTGGVIDFGPNNSDTVTGTNRALGLLSTSTTGSTTFALTLVNTSGADLNYVDLGFVGELWHNGTGHRTLSFGYTIDATATNFTLTSEAITNATLVPSLAFSFPTALNVTTKDGTLPVNQTNLSVTNLQLSAPWPANGALWLIWSIDFFGSGSGNGYAIDNLSFSASPNPIVIGTQPVLSNVAFTSGVGGGLSFSFTNTPGASFTVYSTSSLTPPVTWMPVGAPQETPAGSVSVYHFTDNSTNSQRFYKVTSP